MDKGIVSARVNSAPMSSFAQSLQLWLPTILFRFLTRFFLPKHMHTDDLAYIQNCSRNDWYLHQAACKVICEVRFPLHITGTRRRSTGGGQSYLWSGVWKWSKVACTTSFFAYFLLSPESKTSLCKSSTPTRFQSHVLVCKLLFCTFDRCRREIRNVWWRSSLSIIFSELSQIQFCYDDLMSMGCYWLHWAVLSCRGL